MSTLINLLPDVRQAQLADKRRRQFMIGLSVLIWVICGGVLLLLLVVSAGQKIRIGMLSTSITNKEAQVKNVPGIIDALTAEQHLNSLSSLYSQRVYMTKFFSAYSQASPQDVTLNTLNIDGQSTLTVDGTAKSYAAVAKLDRALEASNVKVGTGAVEDNTPYFSNVNITSLVNDAGGITFSLTATLASGVTSANQ